MTQIDTPKRVRMVGLDHLANCSCLKSALADLIDRSELASGPAVAEFEHKLQATYFPNSHVSAVNSGTSALMAAAMALDLPQGSGVIVPTLSFVASASAFHALGFEVHFAETDQSANISIESVQRILETHRNISAVVCVHLYGNPVAMQDLSSLCKRHDVKLIEDAAQAFDLRINDQELGTFSDCATISFYASKNLPVGEGGLVITRDDDLAARLNQVRNHGRTSQYDYDRAGLNFRMSSLHATIGLYALRYYDGLQRARERNAAYYNERLAGIRHIQVAPVDTTQCKYHQYMIHTEYRDQLAQHLSAQGIDTSVIYPKTLDQTALYRNNTVDRKTGIDLVIAERNLALPVGGHVTTDELDYVVHHLNAWSQTIA